jgi:hypothetical protein
MNEFERRLLDIVEHNFSMGLYADPSRKILNIENYAYSCESFAAPGVNDISPTNPKSFNLIMDSDSDFVLTYMSGGATVNFAANQTKVQWNPALLVQVTDKSTGRTYFNQPTPLPMIAGMNGFPFLMSSPRVIKPRTTIKIDASTANNDAQSLYNGFFFTLHGAKIYYAS